MKILFLGGDKRQLEIVNYLRSKNCEIDLLGYENIEFDGSIKKVTLEDLKISEYDALIFPVSGVGEYYSVSSDFTDKKIILNSTFLNDTKDNALIFTGIKSKSLEEMLDNSNRTAITLMENEEIKRKNSIPTVEGIIADLIINTEFTIDSSKVLILGYGNVGRQLASKLKALGAVITVGVLNSDETKDYETVITSDHNMMISKMLDSDVIVNTVPRLIINEELLRNMNRGTYILDISSYPYGVDFKTADALHIKNKLYLGIPAKVAPKTSGQILATEIDSILKERIL